MRAGKSVNIKDWEKQGQVLTEWNNGKYFSFEKKKLMGVKRCGL